MLVVVCCCCFFGYAFIGDISGVGFMLFGVVVWIVALFVFVCVVVVVHVLVAVTAVCSFDVFVLSV